MIRLMALRVCLSCKNVTNKFWNRAQATSTTIYNAHKIKILIKTHGVAVNIIAKNKNDCFSLLYQVLSSTLAPAYLLIRYRVEFLLASFMCMRNKSFSQTKTET